MYKLQSKKGFTLVELIVVLVILAILAALLIPALTGYIDKANDRAVIAETRACVMAAQTMASEAYAGVTTGSFNFASAPVIDTANTVADNLTAIQGLAEVDGEVTTFTVGTGNKISALTYTSDNGKTVTYAWTAAAGGVYTSSAS